MELWDEIRQTQNLLDIAHGSIKRRGQAKAQTEMDYKVALAKKLLELRSDGFPVTCLSDIARGDEEVAKLRFERDIAQSMYDSAMESINVYKLKIRILEGQLSREWGNTR